MDRRSYRQYCGLAHALDIVGERWTLLIVRNLILGPLRYTDLMRGLPGITTNLLAKRLREMEEGGLVERAQSAGTDAYRLTALGAGLEPAVHALSRWGWKQMGAPGKGEHRSFDLLMVALRRRYKGGVRMRAEIVADDVPYRVMLTPEHAEISRGAVPDADVRVRAPGPVLARVFMDTDARKTRPSGLEVEGPAGAWRTLLGAFAASDAEMAAAG